MRSLLGFDSPLARRLLRLLQLCLSKVSAYARRPGTWRLLVFKRRMRDLLHAACSRRIALNALQISLVVGTVLNLINQGEAIFANTAVSWPHIFLNYLVPYVVATYSAATNQTAQTKDGAQCRDR